MVGSGRTKIRVPRLKQLLVTKLTGRHQDVEDLRMLLWRCGTSVKLELSGEEISLGVPRTREDLPSSVWRKYKGWI